MSGPWTHVTPNLQFFLRKRLKMLTLNVLEQFLTQTMLKRQMRLVMKQHQREKNRASKPDLSRSEGCPLLAREYSEATTNHKSKQLAVLDKPTSLNRPIMAVLLTIPEMVIS
jgi:hypothetical protein